MKPDPDGPVAKLQSLLDKAKIESDDTKRGKLTWDIMKIHMTEGPFFMGCVADYADVMFAKTELKNVPRKENLGQGGLCNPWTHPTPGAYDIEAFYWKNPKSHS